MTAGNSMASGSSARELDKKSVLQSASFGERIAEQEIDELSEYFVETDQWRRLLAGEVDIVYGPKGSGKSALYSLLSARSDELFDRGILIVPAENPSGATAFADVAIEPPTSEEEFIGLWKLYFLGLLAQVLREYGVETDEAKAVYEALQEAGLLEEKASLKGLLRAVREYARAAASAESVEQIGLRVELQNPFEGLTKGQIFQRVVDVHGADVASELLSHSYSCAKPGAQYLGFAPSDHCGICFGCLVRRGAFIASGVVDRTLYLESALVGDSRRENWLRPKQRDYEAVRYATRKGVDPADLIALGLPDRIPVNEALSLVQAGLDELARVEIA